MLRAGLASVVLLAFACAPAQAANKWLAGDLHAHSCYSHDVFCAGEPLETDPVALGEQLITYGSDVRARFQEAAARGLNFLAITDHESTDAVANPGFGAAGVLGLPAYENSIDGHAQMLGARHTYPKDDVVAMRKALHADGGLLQVNHPTYKVGDPFTGCDDSGLRHWQYGYDFVPDTIEVYNPTSPIDGAEAYLECWLQRGERIAITGGSDSHWASLAAAGMGIGAPTTFVRARARTPRGLLAAIRSGRTTVSRRPPAEGGAPVVLRADADGDGRYEATMGDTVPPGTPMRVRSGKAVGIVKVRANGRSLVLEDAALAPGHPVSFRAPAETGWVRASLLAAPESTVGVLPCPGRGQALSTCTYDQLVLALTSPIYLDQ